MKPMPERSEYQQVGAQDLTRGAPILFLSSSIADLTHAHEAPRPASNITAATPITRAEEGKGPRMLRSLRGRPSRLLPSRLPSRT